MTRLEEMEYLLERSRRFYETAKMQVEKGFYDLAMFSFEQSLQLFLKASLLKLGLDFPRTHSVKRLLELLYEITGDKRIQDMIRKYSLELGVLADVYITSRYVAREYTYSEVERIKQVVDEVMRLVREITG